MTVQKQGCAYIMTSMPRKSQIRLAQFAHFSKEKNMKKKLFVLFVVLMSFSLWLTACGGAAAPAAKATADPAKKPAVTAPGGAAPVAEADKAAYESVAKTVADAAWAGDRVVRRVGGNGFPENPVSRREGLAARPVLRYQ